MESKTVSTMLKVGGIVYLIYGIVEVIASVLAISGGALVALVGVGAGMAAEDSGLILGSGVLIAIAGIIGIAGGVVAILAGVLGIKHNANPAKAKSFMVYGIIYLVLQLAAIVSSFNLWNLLFGVALPILYIYGSTVLKKNVQPVK